MVRSAKSKMAIRTTAPSDEGAGFLQSKKTEGEILNFSPSTASGPPSSSEEGKEKDGF